MNYNDIIKMGNTHTGAGKQTVCGRFQSTTSNPDAIEKQIRQDPRLRQGEWKVDFHVSGNQVRWEATK